MPLDDLLTRAAMLSAPLDAAGLDPLRARLFARLRASGWAPSGSPRGARASAESDERLLAAHVAGDAEAFDILFDRHVARLKGYACRFLIPADAEEAVMDAFLVLFQKAPAVLAHDGANVRAFLFGTLRRKISKRLAKQIRDSYEPLSDHLDASSDDSFISLLRREDREDLARAIEAACNPLEQEVLARHMEDLTGPEIAAELDLTPVHVRVLRHRALDKLRKVLAPNGGAL